MNKLEKLKMELEKLIESEADYELIVLKSQELDKVISKAMKKINNKKLLVG